MEDLSFVAEALTSDNGRKAVMLAASSVAVASKYKAESYLDVLQEYSEF